MATTLDEIQYKYGPRSIVAGDSHNDTWFDLVVANEAVNSISVFIRHNSGTYTNPTTYSTGNSPEFVDVGDFDNVTNEILRSPIHMTIILEYFLDMETVHLLRR